MEQSLLELFVTLIGQINTYPKSIIDLLFPKVGLTALRIGAVIKGHSHCIKIQMATSQ